jgi:hypothetical protein
LGNALVIAGEWLAAALAAAAALDAMGRHARVVTLAASAGPLPEIPRRLSRLLALVPARAEGEAVVAAARDLLRERAAGGEPALDVLVVLDGDDAVARRALSGTGAEVLVKPVPGPHKGAVLAWAASELGTRLDRYDFVLVFDADTRLPGGFLSALRIPSGTEAFQLPVAPEPAATGAARVAALSIALALRDDLARDARGLPVRLRGKAMGFTPAAFRAGPARGTRTSVEDSEATLALLARGIVVRALWGPSAREEGTGDAARSRARWLGGHLHLLLTGAGDLARLFVKSPWGALVLALDLWLRPRAVVLLLVLALSLVSTVLLAFSGSEPGALVLSIFTLSWGTLVLEAHALAIVRRAAGLPALTLSDLAGALKVWGRAAAHALFSPARWHRSRPGAGEP